MSPPKLYEVMEKISHVDIQKMAVAMIDTNRTIRQPENLISPEIQHIIIGEILVVNEKIEYFTSHSITPEYTRLFFRVILHFIHNTYIVL